MSKLTGLMARKIVIFDGAMGTELYKRNVFVNTSFESLNLSNPGLISEIHREYHSAGADVLTTNTYGANRNKLSKFGLGEKTAEINKTGVELARKSGGPDTLVAGSVGPIGDIPLGAGLDRSRIVGFLSEQIESLESAGADFIIFETINSAQDAEFALQAISGSKLPFVISFSVDRHCEGQRGEPVTKFLHAVSAAPRKPDAIGLNCGEGAEATLSALETLMPLTGWPVIVQPNAGRPKNVDDRMIYMASPEYLSTYAMRYVSLGAKGIGGCCGTGPEHIKDIARNINPMGKAAAARPVISSASEKILKEPTPARERSKLAAKLLSGQWVTSVEITPPRGYVLDQTIERAAACRAAGVDAINIPDGPRASSRISPIITSAQIQEKAGIETVLHFCCRDKNLIGMQADLLGCAAAGIRNILFITGDPPKLGDYPFASAVFDVDSIGMTAIQAKLNRGVDIGGKEIDRRTEAFIGVGADPNAIDMKRELRRTREKAEAGAEFIITQPVFSTKPLLDFLDAIQDLKIPVIAGIWPLASYRNAEFMKNEVPGVIVPDEIMDRMAKADTKEAQRQTGIDIARESVERIRDRVSGIQVSAPFANVSTALAVIKS
jgi:homocysteine S-methyltransferase